jgi:hypothetical protein
VRIPPDALEHFQHFQGERQITRVITSQRTATAWLGRDLMLGGEETHFSRAAGTPYNQFHPATIHWRLPGGGTGWVLLRDCSRVDAKAEKNMLTILAVGDATFRVSAVGLKAEGLRREQWDLPGLTVKVENDAVGYLTKPGDGFIELEYRGATKFILRTQASP